MTVARLSLAVVAMIAIAPTTAGAADDNLEFRVDATMPYLAFDKLKTMNIEVPGGRLVVGIAPGEFILGTRKVFDWVERSGRAVAAYYEGFPVKSARVLIVPTDGTMAEGGQAFCNAGASLRLLVGSRVTRSSLDEDWQLPHEMVHLAFPTIPKATWLSEGLAVYVEPVARAQAGDLTAEHIWGEFARMMPTGLPKTGDKKIDEADRRERIYWGGAVFWLMADLEIRKRTHNRVGLQDAMLGVLEAAGTCEAVWPIARTLSVADRATGEHVLSELYAQWHEGPVRPDLDAVWRDLGIRLDGKTVRLDDDAPLAAVRRAITARRTKMRGAPMAR